MKKIAITEIAKDIAQELLSMENRQRKLKGDRFNALLASVERLIKDSVSIRFLRSRYNYASISDVRAIIPVVFTTVTVISSSRKAGL